MNNTSTTEKTAEEVIVNELSTWLTKLDLSAHPTKVSIDTSQKVDPQEDTLDRIFTVTVSRHLERVAGAPEPTKAIENSD
jgi:hypothetical protein